MNLAQKVDAVARVLDASLPDDDPTEVAFRIVSMLPPDHGQFVAWLRFNGYRRAAARYAADYGVEQRLTLREALVRWWIW